ncbi:MAG: hypothetical protein EOS68_24630 [Mesorhizobium sp.]|nr:MAG: hypothetical protein EOS68_24630 [Mesorhizobium sp.]
MTLARGLDHLVAGIVDVVVIVAAKTAQLIGTAAAVDDVGAGIALDGLGRLVAGQVDCRGAGVLRGAKDFNR